MSYVSSMFGLEACGHELLLSDSYSVVMVLRAAIPLMICQEDYSLNSSKRVEMQILRMAYFNLLIILLLNN